jgi:molybdopterin/thiamine biosynthesis adenylyltransferase/rhodanese-related sulfurtransferase
MINRYDRHIKLESFGESGQQLLKESKVLVIGVGGLGCAALPYLVSSGVGTIGLMDADHVDKTNLQRQILFSEEEIGLLKINCAINRLSKLNTEVNLIPYTFDLIPENAEEIISQYDVILDCTDRFEARYLINDACVRQNKPWVFGALYKFEGQVSVFNHKSGPTYRCLFPFNAKQQTLPSCSDVGVFAPAVGVVGVTQASEALKVLLDLDQTLSGSLWCIDLLKMNTYIIKHTKNQRAIDQIKVSNHLGAEPSDYIIDLNPEMNYEDYRWIDLREPHETPQISHKLVEALSLSSIEDKKVNWSQMGNVVLFCASGARARILAEELQLSNVRFTDLGAEQLSRRLIKNDA